MTDATTSRFPPRPLRTLGGRALETALNHALALDPDSQASLKALEGRRLDVHLRGPDLAMAIRVVDGKLKVGPADDGTQASLRVSATPGGLLAMAMHAGNEGIAPGKVDIAGDADLARRLEKLARGYAPDFEAAFARVFGDVLGVPLSRAFAKALAHVRDSGRHFVEDGADWLREEARLSVAPGEMDDFLDEVDHLRERAERLEARIQRLAAQRKPDA
ncbi:MAG TPA: SCP2 sterol-binding domain-containing protein [Rhodanobacteraceae bacterium]|nr:SCP2 sterol-binding domain-containing protein [Rhodanobacteraceae bacterium]